MATVISGGHGNPLKLKSAGQNPVTVTATGSILATTAYAIYGAPSVAWTITNLGSVTDSASTATGILLAGGGSITDGASGSTGGLISGGAYGIKLAGTGTVTNFGTITGTAASSYGVQLSAGGVVSNSGMIRGGGGVRLGAAGTVINAGTISASGGDAVLFTQPGALLVIDPGAAFNGAVQANGSGNTIELASASSIGTISGLGSSFTSFGNLTLDRGAVWRVLGASRIAGATAVTVNTGAVLHVDGSLTVTGGFNLSGGGKLGVLTGRTGGLLEIGTAGGAKTGMVTIDAGNTFSGAGQIVGGVVDNGALVIAAGTLAITRALTGTGTATITPGGVLSVSQALGVSGLSFLAGSSSETLQLGTPSLASSTIGGFGRVGNTIDLLSVAVTGSSFSQGVLSLSGAHGSVAALHFAGTYALTRFHVAGDSHGGTNITFS